MARLVTRSPQKAGQAPGTLIHVGQRRTETTRITLIDYDAEAMTERHVDRIEETYPFRDTATGTWINIDGLHDMAPIQAIGQHFGIHPLTLEDIVNTGQRPKFETFDDYLYVVLKMLSFDPASGDIHAEQVSLVLGHNVLFSFQEKPGDVFEMVRERLRRGKGRIRQTGCDYLAYTLIDAVVDHYYGVLEQIAEEAEAIEQSLLESPENVMVRRLHHLKRELIVLRKQVWPLRELLAALIRGESALIRDTTVVFLRDVYDHAVQVIDTVESLRDVLSGLLDLYLSTLSHRMNEVMKVLTIMATLFIPLTFIAGIYGMNFKYMPELEWRWGYAAFWGLIVILAAAMVAFFRKRRWL
jgi:magnesium transporter